MKPSHITKPYRKNFEYASTKLAEPTVHAHFNITKAHQTPSQETSPKLFFLFHIRQTKDHLPSLIYSIVCEWGKRLQLLMLNKKKLLYLAYIFWPVKMRRCNERPRPAGPPSSHTHESTTARTHGSVRMMRRPPTQTRAAAGRQAPGGMDRRGRRAPMTSAAALFPSRPVPSPRTHAPRDGRPPPPPRRRRWLTNPTTDVSSRSPGTRVRVPFRASRNFRRSRPRPLVLAPRPAAQLLPVGRAPAAAGP